MRRVLFCATLTLISACGGKSGGGGSSTASTSAVKQTVTDADVAGTVTVAISDGAMKGTQAEFPPGTLAVGTSIEVQAVTTQPTEIAEVIASGVVIAAPAGVSVSITDASGAAVQLSNPGTLTIAVNATSGLAVDPTKDNIGVLSKLQTDSLIAYLPSQLDYTKGATLPAISIDGSGTYTPAYIGTTIPTGFKAYDSSVPYTEDKTYTITASDVTKTSMTLSWSKAIDDVSAATAITYKLVQSSSANIDTMENTDANGTVLMDWRADVGSYQVSGLTAETSYTFNVLAKDESGNIRVYTQLTTKSGYADRRVFLTANNTLTGNLGGITGADALCAADSAKPSGSATWKAFIVQTGVRVACTTANCSGGVSENTDWVLKPNTTYKVASNSNTVGTTNAAGIFTFPLSNMIDSTTKNYWTGFASALDWTAGSNLCTNWTSANSGVNGDRGRADATTVKILANAPTACNVDSQLLCVEQ